MWVQSYYPDNTIEYEKSDIVGTNEGLMAYVKGSPNMTEIMCKDHYNPFVILVYKLMKSIVRGEGIDVGEVTPRAVVKGTREYTIRYRILRSSGIIGRLSP